MIKRGFDFTVSLVSLLVLAPVFLVIALMIKRDSPGPVFYRSQRAGQNGKPFLIYWFRCTVAATNGARSGIGPPDVTRLTRFGRRLHRSQLHALPLLINVLRGEMSLVGPSPVSPVVADEYTPLYRRLLASRPGLTGPALLARLKKPDVAQSSVIQYSDGPLREHMALELRYLMRRSFWTDIRIIGATIGVVFGLDSVAFHWLARSLRRYVPWLLRDGPVVATAFYAALLVRLMDNPTSQLGGYFAVVTRWLLPIIVLYLVTTSLWGVHRRVWRFATAADVRPIFAAALAATAIVLTVDLYSGTRGPRLLPLGVLLLGGFFSACGMVLVRYPSRLLRGLTPRGRSDGEGTRAVVYGAGDAGQHLALRFLTHQSGEIYDLIGFVDDDVRKLGQRIHGLPVLGGRHELAQIVERRRVDLIIIAINNVKGEDLRQILTAAQKTSAQIRIIPNVFEVGSVANTAPFLREVRVEDLLGRQSVQLHRDACERVVRDKVVLVTGGCGSVGSELCRQVAKFQPKHLVILDNNETGLYDLELALKATFPQLNLSVVIADVTNAARIDAEFHSIRPEVIFHAAAYKHVPLMERFPQEAVKVNVGGTAVVLETARRYAAQYFVLVSTDKAVEPNSVMGATKRVAEMLVVGHGHESASNGSSTLCTAVRFGNVLGSRGSVVPTFARQIDRGGPVTVTHPDMTRYFMDVSEAAGLIIQAASFTDGGDIFMLEMGERIRVDDLARKMIRMRGLRPEIDIAIVYTGVRPGEKLHEELAFAEEGREHTEHPLVNRLRMPTEEKLNGSRSPIDVEHLLETCNNEDGQVLVSEVMRLARGLAGAKDEKVLQQSALATSVDMARSL